MIHAYRALPYRSSFLAPHLVLGMFVLVGCSKESGSLPEAQDPQQIAQPPAGLTTPDTVQVPWPQPEDAPSGVRFPDTAATPEALAALFRANFAWRDPDGAQLYVRIDSSARPSGPSFTLNRAYHVRQNERSF
jgi:hypothetical protein